MSSVLKFYDVNTKYTDYLRKIDSRIPNIVYGTNNKFVCGVVLEISGYKYFAPISSKTEKQRTGILIQDKNGTALSSIKFCFMFPAPDSVVSYKDFAEVSKVDKSYANLLEIEWEYCKNNEKNIYEKAKKVYKIGCNKKHVLNMHCCDFHSLEKAHDEWVSGSNKK